MTKVVNLYKEPYDIYIGRAGKGKDGTFGNPFNLVVDTSSQRAAAIEYFKDYFYEKLEKDQKFKEKALQLKDKTLGCFCKPKACHGDVIAEWLDNQD